MRCVLGRRSYAKIVMRGLAPRIHPPPKRLAMDRRVPGDDEQRVTLHLAVPSALVATA
ncbi:hypothetical protein BRAS3843_3110011 [Bradyrhizobium sp. STM 3843]|nr:hypothetical protein BRAS3843_3110011 [Bradyrhizobium sp. STM 3843]